MSEKHRIRDGIIIGVSVLAIWTGAIWIFPSIKAISKSVLAFVLGILGTPIPLWVWLLGTVLSVAVISTKRRIVRAVEASKEPEEEMIPTPGVWIDRGMQQPMPPPAPTNEPAIPPTTHKDSQAAPTLTPPPVQSVPIESVGIEEYDDEEEEEDWRSYTSDNILDIDWRWRWHGTSIESLIALCPECELELLEQTRPFSNAGYDNREWLMGLTCQDEECQFEHNPDAETVHEYHDIIEKHIRREARNRGWPV